MKQSLIMKKFKSLMPYFLLALLIIAAYRISGELAFFVNLFRGAWSVVAPFFYGFLLAYVINIPCSGIQKLLGLTKSKFIIKKKKSLSLLIVFLLFAFLVFSVLNLIIPAIVSSVAHFIVNVPVYWESLVQSINYFNNLELFGLHISADEIFHWLGGMLDNFSIERLQTPINAIMGAASSIFRGVIAFISSIYILIEKEKCKAHIDKLLNIFGSEKFRVSVSDIFDSLNKNLRRYIHTQTIDGIILGIMATVVLSILGSPYALVLGIMLGVVNYIPYFGSLFGTIFAVIVVIFTQGFTTGLISAGALLIVQQIDANIVQPRLISGSFSLSPLLVIISITIGGALAGILGMIVAIPIVAVLIDIYDKIITYYERKKIEG